MRRVAALPLCLLLLSCGSDPCDLGEQKTWLRSWTNDVYLWYAEVPTYDPAPFTDPVAYFDVLKTPVVLSSGRAKDRFHFTYPTDVWIQLSQSGVEVGYGLTWILLATKPPRKAVVGYDEPNLPGSPALTNNLGRGVEVLTVDGVDLVNASDQASVDKLNAGLFPAAAGERHTFTVRDPDTTVRTVQMTAVNVTSTPVQNVHAIDTPTGKVGYMLFNDHIATAEKQLVDAVNQLDALGIGDLILDVRYNGGGYVAIASQLAYMIAGSTATSGKTFEKTVFNDKHPTTNPVTGQPITATGFISQTVGFSVSSGKPLPTLALPAPRVFVLTGPGTCSATEAILNGLSGIDVPIVQIGAATCGKPYGFYPQDKCGTTYFSIEFQGANQKGFGDYPDGFTPVATPGFAGCVVDDDFGHALGDSQEALLAAALQYKDSQTCPPAPPARNALTSGGLRGNGVPLKPPWRTNRILLP